MLLSQRTRTPVRLSLALVELSASRGRCRRLGFSHKLAAYATMGVCGGLAAAQCPPSLDFGANLATGTTPLHHVVADFNNDGKLDIAAANQFSNSVSVMLGNGDGTFAPSAVYPTGSEPYYIVAVDLNGDNVIDLITANHGSNNVSVLQGVGTGAFALPVNYPAGLAPIAIGVGDFDQNGRPDLAVVNQFGANVSILLGNVAPSIGTLQPPVNYAVGNGPTGIVVRDFNVDGRLDLAVTNYDDNSVSVLRGQTFNPGTFLAAVNYPTGAGPRAIASTDLNRDGRPDLAVANYLGNSVSVLLVNGPPTAGTFQTALTYSTAAGPHGLTVQDMNNDGQPDIVIAHGGADAASILINSCPPYGTSVQTLYSWSTPGGPTSVAVGDFNRDGRPDLAVACAGANVVRLLNGFATYPIITQQPTLASVRSGDPASFSVASSGNTSSYQWRRNGVPLSNGSGVFGATSPTLTLGQVALSDNAVSFDCMISNSCGTTTSNPAGLAVRTRCTGDFNQSGSVTVQDIFDFLTNWFSTCP